VKGPFKKRNADEEDFSADEEDQNETILVLILSSSRL